MYQHVSHYYMSDLLSLQVMYSSNAFPPFDDNLNIVNSCRNGDTKIFEIVSLDEVVLSQAEQKLMITIITERLFDSIVELVGKKN